MIRTHRIAILSVLLLVSCTKDPKANDPRIFKISPEQTTVSAYSHTLEYTVSCDRGWNVSKGKAGWVTITETAKDKGKIYVSIDFNEDDSERRDTIFISSGTITREVYIVQTDRCTAFMSFNDYGIYGSNLKPILKMKRGEDQTAVFRSKDKCSFRMQNIETGDCISLEGMPAEIKTGSNFKVKVGGNMTSLPHAPGTEITLSTAKIEGRKIWLYASDGTGYIVKK